jgi:hypothetical protein
MNVRANNARAEANKIFDTCQVEERTPSRTVKCNQQTVATITDSLKSYRVCEKHAAQMERTKGSHTVKRD